MYATDKNAVLVTHDVEFTRRRKHHTIGRHLRLVCSEPDGASLVLGWLDELVAIFDEHAEVVIELRRDTLRCFRGWDGSPQGHVPVGRRKLWDGSMVEL